MGDDSWHDPPPGRYWPERSRDCEYPATFETSDGYVLLGWCIGETWHYSRFTYPSMYPQFSTPPRRADITFEWRDIDGDGVYRYVETKREDLGEPWEDRESSEENARWWARERDRERELAKTMCLKCRRPW